MVALSFDIEEFDLPLETGTPITFDRQIEISRFGATRILDILKRCGVRATLFTTYNFAKNAPDILRRIVAEGHELASHGMEHTAFKISDLKEARERLSSLAGVEVKGFRMPRLRKLPDGVIAAAGYSYDSSLNPTFIPGRYNNLRSPRTPFMQDGLLEIPASVSPTCRLPLFWLAAHHYPFGLYLWLAKRARRKDGLFTTYFHPWEFFDLDSVPEYRVSALIRHNAGDEMCRRLEALIKTFQKEGAEFVTYSEIFARNTHKI